MNTLKSTSFGLAFVLLITMSACKSSKDKQATTAKTDNTEKVVTDTDRKVTEKVSAQPMTDASAKTEPVKANEQQKPAKTRPPQPDTPAPKVNFPDSLFASIERTPCFGRCPAYKLQIYKSGYTLYEGKHFVDNIGFFSTQTTKEEMDMLLKKAEAVNLYSLKDTYDGPVTDLPSTTTVLNADKRKKITLARFNVPDELVEFQNYFDSIFAKKEWTPVEGKGKK